MSTQIFDGKLIKLDTEYADLGDATVKEIWYQKPSGETGKWTATAATTFLSYQCQVGDIDEIGPWIFQTHIVISGLPFTGEEFLVTVKKIIIVV